MAREKQDNAPETSLFSFSQEPAHVPGQDRSGVSTSDVTNPESMGFGKRRPADEAVAAMPFASSSDATDLGPQYGYRKSRFRRHDEVSIYTDQMDSRYAMDSRKRMLVILTVLVIVLIPVFVIAPTSWLSQQGMARGLAGFIEALQSNVTAIGHWITGVPDGNGIQIVFWQILAVAIVGAALSLNGAVYQGAMKNALASPSTLGVMSGGTLGTLVYTLAFVAPESAEITEKGYIAFTTEEMNAYVSSLDPLEYFWMIQGRALCSVIGCFTVVALVLLIAHIAGRGKVSKSALIIAGQVFASVIAGVVAIARTYVSLYGSDAQIEAMRSVVGGSVSSIMSPFDLALIGVPLLIGFIIIMRLRFRLNLLTFNDDEARSLGISVAGTRNAVMIVCTVMTAVIVSFCGNVGFVGFIVPHLARMMVGPDLRYLIPASALLGAVYLLVANYLMSLGGILVSSLGLFTSLIGVVFFIVAIIQQRRRGNVDWI